MSKQLPKLKVHIKNESCSDLLEKKKEVATLLTKPKEVDTLIALLDDVFSEIEQYPAITRDDFRLLLEGRCKASILKIDQTTEREEKKPLILKALHNAQECIINQPSFATGYTLYANAFVKYAQLMQPEKVFTDETERKFIKQVKEIGTGVVEQLKAGLEIGEISREGKADIHTAIAKCLRHMFWSTDDFVEGEEQEEKSFEEISTLMFARQSLMFSGGLDDLNDKADQLVEKVTASTQTHLKSKMFTLRIQVLGFRPYIWRRVKVPGSITLSSLQDRVIAPVMGWCRNYHAYYFRKIPFEYSKKQMHGIPEPDFVFGPIYSQAVDKMHEYTHNIYTADDTKVELFQILEKVGDEMLFLYDLGDGFRHKIVVEDVQDSNNQSITVEDGENCCPPEDCGSIHSYVDALHVFYYGPAFKNNPAFAKDKSSHGETISKLNMAANYRERKGNFDPNYFSLVEAKRHVQNALRNNASKLDDRNFFKFNFQTGSTQMGNFEETKLLSKKPVKACAICKATENLKQCSKCRSVYYCSREHQLEDWKTHKNVCGKEKQ